MEDFLEKYLFAKIEAWILAIVAIVALIGAVFFGSMVRYVANGGEKAGFVGATAYHISGIPALFKDVLTGNIKAKDFQSHTLVTARAPGEYQPLAGLNAKNLEDTPIYWTANQVAHEPIALMFRLNKRGDEHLVVLDRGRKVVGNFPIFAPSFTGKFQPLIGHVGPTMLDDGSVIVFAHGSDGLYRKTLCGEVIWSLPGLYHHSYSVADGKLGVLGLPIAKPTKEDRGELKWNHSEIINIIDVETGTIEKSITIEDIVRANAGKVDPFSWRLWKNNVNQHGVLDEDLIHLNKVELLPKAIADQYPGIPAGAFALSSRNFNLLAIVHPDTLEILWHRQGFTEGQHDPEFIGNGEMLIFNNAISKNSTNPDHPANFSSIRKYNFNTDEWSVHYSAAPVKGFTGHAGELDFKPNGGPVLMDITAQGRYLEVSPSGEVLSEYVNKAGDKGAYWTKHAAYLTDDQVKKVRQLSCVK